MARSIRVTEAEAELIDKLGEIGIDVPAFVARIERALEEGRKHPLTIAAAHVESASFETPVERGEIEAPTPTF